MTVILSPADIDLLKAQLHALAPHAKASHRAEAMARGFGFGRYASLLAALGELPLTCTLDDEAFSAFLRDRDVAVAPATLSTAVAGMKLGAAKRAIEAVLERMPDLSANGYRTWSRDRTGPENKLDFESSRRDLLHPRSFEEFVRAQAFLETRQKSRNVSRARTSYGYKHEAERFHKAAKPGSDTYISNGVFLAAAEHLGFKLKRDGWGPNAFINIAAEPAPRRRGNVAGAMRGLKKKAAWRNIMVAAVNAGVEQGVFGLGEDDNHWNGDRALYRFDFAGLPAMACASDAGFGELSVHVAINPTRHAHEWVTAYDAGFKAGEAFASGWLERREGTWLQMGAAPTGSVRTKLLDHLVANAPSPNGFADHGKTM